MKADTTIHHFRRRTCMHFSKRTMQTTEFTPRLTLPSAKRCLEIFDEVDEDRIGMLPLPDIGRAVLKIWPDFQQTENICDAYNVSKRNGESVIQRKDFAFFLTQLCCCENIWSPSSSLIANRERRISVEDILAAVPELENNGLSAVLHEMDTNEDGHVMPDEFLLRTTLQSTSIRRRSFGAGYHIASSLTSGILADELENLGERNQSYLTRVILRLRCSLKILDAAVTDEEIEAWAALIYSSLSNNARSSGNMDDFFSLTDLVDPYQMIAALFSDFVFYLREKRSQEVEVLLAGVYEKTPERGVVRISPINPKVDKALAMVKDIFGYTAGQTIITQRIFSLYLSAIAAARILKNAMPLADLAQIVICIYSLNFIVARKENFDSLKYMNSGLYDSNKTRVASESSDPTSLDPNVSTNVVEEFFGRFLELNKKFELGMNEKSLVQAVQRAVDSANRVAGYLISDFEIYMRRTWNMLPCMALPLQELKLFTVNDFHSGVLNLLRVYSISSATIFTSFRGTPLALEIESFERKAAQNLKLGKTYVEAVAVTLSIISAFALLSGGCGGDAPMSYFLGEESSHQVRDHLPETTMEISCNQTVYKCLCLHSKRTLTAPLFDNNILPITKYIYGKIGDNGVKKVLNYTTYPMQECRAKMLLSLLPNNVVMPIGKGLATVAIVRAETIEDILCDLKACRERIREPPKENLSSFP